MDIFPSPHQSSPRPALPTRAYYHLIHTLTATLPPPPDDAPHATLARNHAAIDKIAALLPTNANEVDLAAQCIAARAQASDILRLIRVHEGDIKVVIRLNAQYAAMLRASATAYAQFLRAQAVRFKREKSDDALKADEWTHHIVGSELRRAMKAGPAPAGWAEDQDAPGAVAGEGLRLGEGQPPVESPAGDGPAATPLSPDAAPAAPVPAIASPPPESAKAAVLAAPGPSSSGGAQAPAPAPQRPESGTATDPDAEEPRDLRTEVERYVAIYPRRAREIRQCGGLPPDCSFGPPDDALVHAIVAGSSPALRALDGADFVTAQGGIDRRRVVAEGLLRRSTLRQSSGLG